MVTVQKVKCHFLVILLTSIFLLNITTFFVYAGTGGVDSVCNIGKSQTVVSSICNQANNSVGKNKILTYTSSTGLLKFSNSKYSKLNTSERRTFMETALLATKEARMGSQVQMKVYNFISSQDTTISSAIRYLKSDASADFVAAQSWFRPFSGVFGTIMGCLCLFIFLFLGLSIVWDLAYLCLPTAKALFERGKPDVRPVGVSREAWSSSKDAERELSYRNVLSVYFQRRIGQLIIMCIALGYVISGKVYDLIVFFIDSFAI